MSNIQQSIFKKSSSIIEHSLKLLTFGYIKHYFKHDIPISLKLIIVYFSNKCLPLSILTIQQDITLMDILRSKLKFIPTHIQHLFTASKHNFLAQKFHEACNNKQISNTLVLIQSNYGNLFGGFTTQSWNTDDSDPYAIAKYDEDAFIFLLKSDDAKVQQNCPYIFELKPDDRKYAIWRSPTHGPCFGLGVDVYIDDQCNKKKKVNSSNLNSYCNDQFPHEISLCGGKSLQHSYRSKHFTFDVIEYQIWHIVE